MLCFSLQNYSPIIAIVALAVSIISLMLSRSISFRRTVRNKQFDAVCELINDFATTPLMFTYVRDNGGDGGTDLMYFTHFKSPKFKERYKHLFSIKHLYIQNLPHLSFKFMQHYESRFIPQQIKNELQNFWLSYTTIKSEADLFELAPYVVLKDMENASMDSYVVSDDDRFKSMEGLHVFINHFMDTINRWLEKYRAEDLKFRKDIELR
jgi:hypothetical protein